MKRVKAALLEDQAMQKEIIKTGRTFEFFWELLKPEEMSGLRFRFNEPGDATAYFKKMMFAVLRAYTAGRQAPPFLKAADLKKSQQGATE